MDHNSFVLAVLMRMGGVLLLCELPDLGRPSTKPAWIVQIGGVSDFRLQCVGLRMKLYASACGHAVNASQSSAGDLCHVNVSSND